MFFPGWGAGKVQMNPDHLEVSESKDKHKLKQRTKIKTKNKNQNQHSRKISGEHKSQPEQSCPQLEKLVIQSK